MPTAMRLYHCPDARSLRPLWTLEELGLDYELVNMRFPPRTEYPGYLGINPLGTVPTFVDGELTMTESTGICHYLVERHAPNDLRVDPADPAYGDYLNWLYRSDATLTFPQTIVLRYTRLEPEARRLPQAVEDYSIWYLSRLRSRRGGAGGARLPLRRTGSRSPTSPSTSRSTSARRWASTSATSRTAGAIWSS